VVELSDRIAVLNEGRMFAWGSRATLCTTRAWSASIWARPMLLEARNLHVGYGDASAVWDVSLDVEAGGSCR